MRNMSNIQTVDSADYHAEKYTLQNCRLWVLLVKDERQEISPMMREKKSKERIENDIKELEETFHWTFGESVDLEKITIDRMTTKSVLEERLKESAKLIPNEVGVFLCVFLGFGRSQYILLPKKENKEEMEKMDFSDVIKPFNGENCTALVMKPKLFFVQAETIDPVKPCSALFSGNAKEAELFRIPIHADIFVNFSSELAGKDWNQVLIPGEKEGSENVMSRYVKLLCSEVKELTSRVEIQQMVTRINYKIQKEISELKKKPSSTEDLLPLTTSQLTKSLFLFEASMKNTVPQ
ncbi:caspase-7-like [Ylistrum balloti]|uniref:caspase-7-like n=1 Tax=Ylistrum balloti TaxID=509963 RepID=UPI002905DF2C|nr:caspase-7-like [Ylistrum balloti]